MTYSIDDKQGRGAKIDKFKVTDMSITSTATLLPETPLPRRTYIKILNLGSDSLALLSSSSGTFSDGYPVGTSGSSIELNTNADIYGVSVAGTIDIRIIEISKAY